MIGVTTRSGRASMSTTTSGSTLPPPPPPPQGTTAAGTTVTVTETVGNNTRPSIHPAFRGMPVPTVQKFMHTHDDPTMWLSNYDCITNLCQLPEELKLQQIRLYLDPEAARWLDTVPEEHRDTWPKFCHMFKTRWDQTTAASKFNMFVNLKQQPNQSVRDFVTKVQHAAVSLNYNEEQLLPYLLDKVLPSLKPDIMRANPTSVIEFIEAATRAEAIAAAQSQVLAVQPDVVQMLLSEIKNLKTNETQTQVSSLHAPDMAKPSKFNQPPPKSKQKKASHKPHPSHHNGVYAPEPTQYAYQPYAAEYPHDDGYAYGYYAHQRPGGPRMHNPNPHSQYVPQQQFRPRPMVPTQSYMQMQRGNNWERQQGYGQSYAPSFSQPYAQSSSPQCMSCNGFGHARQDCPNRNDICTACHKKGHSEPACRRNEKKNRGVCLPMVHGHHWLGLKIKLSKRKSHKLQMSTFKQISLQISYK